MKAVEGIAGSAARGRKKDEYQGRRVVTLCNGTFGWKKKKEFDALDVVVRLKSRKLRVCW